MNKETKEANCLEVGFNTALVSKKNSLPLRCYVGKVKAVDDKGVRLTLIDWVLCNFTGHDLFVTWDNIESAFVATPEDEMSLWIDRAGDFQTEMNKED